MTQELLLELAKLDKEREDTNKAIKAERRKKRNEKLLAVCALACVNIYRFPDL